MKISAATHLTARSGIRLPIRDPKTMPIAFDTIMPSVVPIQTVQTALYLTAREIVASCVLSPISAMKKATVTVQKGLK